MGFMRYGTNSPMKVITGTKSSKKAKCSACGEEVEAGLLKRGKCKACCDKSAKK